MTNRIGVPEAALLVGAIAAAERAGTVAANQGRHQGAHRGTGPAVAGHADFRPRVRGVVVEAADHEIGNEVAEAYRGSDSATEEGAMKKEAGARRVPEAAERVARRCLGDQRSRVGGLERKDRSQWREHKRGAHQDTDAFAANACQPPFEPARRDRSRVRARRH